ncbi:MAG: hypothetical protein AAGD32_09030 [Planctomycetota bacterium]
MTPLPQRTAATDRLTSDTDVAPSTICPFCAAIRSAVADEACPRCSLPDTPATRTATSARLGPWFVFQRRNPAAPGMNWTTLRQLIDQGRVKPRSVVRGPTTGQLWVPASKARGVSRLFGLCWQCGESIAKTAELCPECNADQVPPGDPDALLALGTVRRRPVAKVPNTWRVSADGSLPEAINAEVPAAAKPPGPVKVDRPRGRKRRLALAVLLLAAIGLGGFVAYDPGVVPRTWEAAQDYDWAGAWEDVKSAVAGQPKSKAE